MSEVEKAAEEHCSRYGAAMFWTSAPAKERTYKDGFVDGAAWQAEQVRREIRAAARHYLEATGNLTQAQKNQAHDTLLVMEACLKHGLFAKQTATESIVQYQHVPDCVKCGGHPCTCADGESVE